MLQLEAVKQIINGIITYASIMLIPMMIFGFVFAVTIRFLIYSTVKRNEWFAVEFEKRVNNFMDSDRSEQSTSFYVTLKRLLEKTFYECFITRSILKRRRPDSVLSVSDRVFLIQQGAAWLVKDILKRIKFLRYTENQQHKLLQMTKTTFHKNPCFNKLFGLIPVSGLNDILNLLPGILIVSGIFGTFLGIMGALPELKEMDLTNAELTKQVMNDFLVKISYAMSTSLLGIGLSVSLSIVNTIFSPEKVFTRVVDRFESCLDIIWNLSDNNNLPLAIKDFDEHRDPMEALAEASIEEEINRSKSGHNRGEPIMEEKKEVS